MTWIRVLCVAVACGFVVPAMAADQPGVVHQDFANDPKWDALNNRLVPKPVPITRQHFGWRNSNHAGGKSKGEIGGRVQRSATPAVYATGIKPRTLNEKLRMSGRFAVTKDDGATGVLFGWFNQNSRGWRTPNSLAVRIDGNGPERGYILFYEYGTQNYLAGGGGAFEGPRYQTTKTPWFKPDGTSHTFTFEYDSAGANGDGLMTFTLDGNRKYQQPLDPGHKAYGATFDRFGIWNAQTTGGAIEVYFDDLEVNGETLDFAADPKWQGRGNDVEFEDRILRPYHDFGFSRTHRAGGKAAGELGGVIWRDDAPAY